MVQKKSPAAAKSTAPKEEIKKPPVVKKPAEEKQTAPEEVKTTHEPEELSPIDKWNIVKVILIQKFPVFQPGELDIDGCTIEDRKVHVRTTLRMTDKEIAAIIPGY